MHFSYANIDLLVTPVLCHVRDLTRGWDGNSEFAFHWF